ncbi:MAG: polymer-forming cytoskeletal protein [Clostridia bacterium]|nr:polymer-forming cytoskeletal protein [Clostridia bacterium]
MAIKRNAAIDTAEPTAELVLPAKSTFHGDFTTNSNARIEGTVDGNIIAENGNILLGEQARVIGNIKGVDVAVAGSVKGDLDLTGQLSIYSGAEVVGNVKATAIIVENNAVFDGHVTIMSAANSRAAIPEKLQEVTQEAS